jgi:hypothetical protein
MRHQKEGVAQWASLGCEDPPRHQGDKHQLGRNPYLHEVTDTGPGSRRGCSGRQMCKQLNTDAGSESVLF